MGSSKTQGSGIAAAVRKAVEPLAEQAGLSLWDVRFVKEGASWFLKILIDKEGGISLSDCEELSKKVSKLLDELDPIEQSYFLEVSSAGIERELTSEEHYRYAMGKRIRIRLIRETNGMREMEGILSDKQKTEIKIALDSGETAVINEADAAYVKLQEDTDTEGINDNE